MKRTEKKHEDGNALFVVRMRGTWGARYHTKRTMQLMHLTRRYHATLLKADALSRGMLHEAANYLAWGPADVKTLEALLTKRAEVEGRKPLTTEYLAKNSSFKTIPELATALAKGSASLSQVKGLKPLFRLHPPRGGVESVKRSGKLGALGDKGPAVNEMVQRML